MESSYRKTILGPGEVADNDRYVQRSGLEAQEPLNFTRFRCSERHFKRSIEGAICPQESSLLFKPVETIHQKKSSLSRIRAGTAKACELDGYPGVLFIPQLLTRDEQLQFAEEIFFSSMKSPNQCNFDANYEIPNDFNLVEAIYQSQCTDSKPVPLRGKKGKKDLAVDAACFQLLRWYTVGYQYDWTSKEYILDDFIPLTPLLHDYACDISSWIGHTEFSPEAAVLNVYHTGSTLMGHVDRSEKNMEAPLVSISIGRSCVFLIGGETREDPVVGVILRSGDAMILRGKARTFYHGVPQIISDSTPIELTQNSDQDSDRDKFLKKILKECRLNVNVRQVH